MDVDIGMSSTVLESSQIFVVTYKFSSLNELGVWAVKHPRCLHKGE